jgi:hypothetical protein
MFSHDLGRFDPFAKPSINDRYLPIPLKKSWVWRGFGWITGPEVGDVFVLLAAYSGRGRRYAGSISGSMLIGLKRARRLRF